VPRLETERLLLREWTLEDLPRVVPIYTDPVVMRHVGKDPDLSPEGVERGIRATLRRYERHGMGFMALVRKRDGDLLGHCGLQRYDGTLDVELGYLLRRDARGRGYATEAALASVAYAFDVLDLKRVVAVVVEQNRPSIAVLERVGMTFRKRVVYKGVEAMWFAVERR